VRNKLRKFCIQYRVVCRDLRVCPATICRHEYASTIEHTRCAGSRGRVLRIQKIIKIQRWRIVKCVG